MPNQPSDTGGADTADQKSDAALLRAPSVMQPMRTLAEREGALEVREAVASASASAKQSDDIREANAHLIMATLAAEASSEAARKTKLQQDEFLAMLAHELRNPLAPIRTAVALLERLDTVDPRLKKIREVVGRQVDHMARLLDDLLDASRVTSGKVTLQRRPTSVREFVDQAVEIYRMLIDSQHQELTLDMPVTPIYVDGDLTRLAQIVGNLLHNASKYTPYGGAISVSARSSGESVVLKVTDNGSGIAQESLAHIFELFGQEERSLSRSQGGLGIGLTVVRGMVERHGGTVEVRSDGLGMGSEFTVVLPRLNYVEEAAPEHLPKPTFVPARILVVDDNVDANEMLVMLLQMSGYEVEFAFDGPGALLKYSEQRSEIVVCDIGLPGMNGYEVAERIRHESGAEFSGPTLIALTGYDGVINRAHALRSGFDHHVVKPVDFNVLLQLIEARDSGDANQKVLSQ